MWQASGNQSTWSTGVFSAQVNLAKPSQGLLSIRVLQQPADGLRPLQLTARNEPGGEAGVLREGYIRGKDLVGSYAESSAQEFLPQIYWRMVEATGSGRIAGLEVILSVQTRLLDSTAAAQSVTQIGPGEVLRWSVDAGVRKVDPTPLNRLQAAETTAPTIVLFRPAECAWSYAEMVYPADFRRWRWAPLPAEAGWNEWGWSLFAERLEKGVIRRGRLRAIWLRRENDVERVGAEYADFLNTPLPLTA